MVRTFASFTWDVPIAADAQQPYAESEVANLVASFRAAGIELTQPMDAEFAWDFFGKLPHIEMYCQLGLVESNSWLLTCHPQRSFVSWILRRWWEQEQEDFVRRLNEELRSEKRISEVRWYSPEEWNRVGV